MVVNMKAARLRIGLVKAAETARSLAGLVKNHDARTRLLDKAERLAQRAKELPCE
jgi:hypothetical protein